MSDDPITRILAIVERLEGSLTRLEAELTRLRADLVTRLERMGDSLTAIRDDIATNFGTAEQAQRANDNTRSELRSLNNVVMAMHRQIQRLQADVRTPQR